jgi:hypothetical protein
VLPALPKSRSHRFPVRGSDHSSRSKVCRSPISIRSANLFGKTTCAIPSTSSRPELLPTQRRHIKLLRRQEGRRCSAPLQVRTRRSATVPTPTSTNGVLARKDAVGHHHRRGTTTFTGSYLRTIQMVKAKENTCQESVWDVTMSSSTSSIDNRAIILSSSNRRPRQRPSKNSTLPNFPVLSHAPSVGLILPSHRTLPCNRLDSPRPYNRCVSRRSEESKPQARVEDRKR